ncbi:MAG: glycosyltransferase [halophilic archaeon J07HX64]|jgi:Glycosyltransferase|nr:MAG: glycosyltransferase [halophilic archaeon J07HX64]
MTGGRTESKGEDRTDTALPGVCVVTHPLGSAGENATRTLLDILSAVTAVSLVTAYLPEDSAIRTDHEVVEVTEQDAAQSTILLAAVRFLRNQLRMCRVIYRRDEQVILFFGATAYLLPVLWAKLLGRTVLLEPRGDVPLTLRLGWEQRVPTPVARLLAGTVRLIERLGYLSADRVVTYTPGMARELGLDRYSGKLYTEGARYVDTDRFSPATPYGERDSIVGFLGRLDEEKGIRELAAVARRLPEDITFRFVGDGPLRGWLETELERERETGQVEVTGWVEHDDVPAELNDLQLLVMPSEPTEGLPTVILEAMACGTPAYATPVSGVPDVVRERRTGFLMASREPKAIAADIEAILDRDNLEDVSRRAHELATSEYSFEAAVDRYTELLTDVTGSERHRD